MNALEPKIRISWELFPCQPPNPPTPPEDISQNSVTIGGMKKKIAELA